MESSEEPTQPVIGFPLALALLLIFLCFMSGLCISCLHWNKLRSFLGGSSRDLQDPHAQDDLDHIVLHKCVPPHQDMKNQGNNLPVLMPGDKVPKFIAISRPSQPEKFGVQVQKPPT